MGEEGLSSFPVDGIDYVVKLSATSFPELVKLNLDPTNSSLSIEGGVELTSLSSSDRATEEVEFTVD